MDSERNGINGGQTETESSSSVMVNDQQNTKYGSHDNCVGNFEVDDEGAIGDFDVSECFGRSCNGGRCHGGCGGRCGGL